MSYYDDEYPRRRGFLPTILLSLVSAVIGGLLSLSLAPMVYGPEMFKVPQQPPIIQEPGKEAPLPGGYQDYSPVVTIAERVGPTVVGISNRAVTQDFFGRERVVERGSGSGVIISKEGHIVTNYHVIEKAQSIGVNLADGRQVDAQVVGSDPRTDLAVLKINAPNIPVADLGDSNQIKVGELVVAIGNPLGYEFARSVTAGVVSAKERNITIEERKFKLIQTDAAINPGNSGGALVNSRGQVIGINSAKLVIPGVEGMGFAIPISDARPIINELIERGYISRPSLGIYGAVIDERTARLNELPQGIYIDRVIPGGAAQKAGLKSEDIIVGINGQKVTNFDELSEVLKQFKPGDQITVNIYRGNKKLDVPLTLGEMPRE
ncbi:MAG: htrA [Peptococcaceae bacterium]|jgi:serine protease Do|nr:htrA [Peptococcaceae bacterium]